MKHVLCEPKKGGCIIDWFWFKYCGVEYFKSRFISMGVPDLRIKDEIG